MLDYSNIWNIYIRRNFMTKEMLFNRWGSLYERIREVGGEKSHVQLKYIDAVIKRFETIDDVEGIGRTHLIDQLVALDKLKHDNKYPNKRAIGDSINVVAALLALYQEGENEESDSSKPF